MEAAKTDSRGDIVARRDGHPLHYLTCLNQLFSYGDNMR